MKSNQKCGFVLYCNTAKRNEPDSKTAEVLTPQKRRSTRVSSQTTESCDASQQSDLEDGVDESNSKRHKS